MRRTSSNVTENMELARLSEMSVPSRRTTWRSVPENITIHSHRHENLVSHTMNILVILSFVKYHTVKSSGNGGKVPHIFRRVSRWSLVTSFISPPPHPPLYFRGKKTPGNYRLGDVTRPELERKENLCVGYPDSSSSPCLTLRFYLELIYVSRNALYAYACTEVLRFYVRCMYVILSGQ